MANQEVHIGVIQYRPPHLKVDFVLYGDDFDEDLKAPDDPSVESELGRVRQYDLVLGLIIVWERPQFGLVSQHPGVWRYIGLVVVTVTGRLLVVVAGEMG